MGRLHGVVRPCIATPMPRLGRTPAVLLDAGANAECTPAMLVQFAQMGAAYATARFGGGVTHGRPALHRRGDDQGHAAGQGDPRAVGGRGTGLEFVGNVEGRDLLPSPADVIVTDGFTGNVALKTLEGSLRFLFDTLLGRLRDQRRDPARRPTCSCRTCCPLAAEFDPENTGGAMLLGVDGVCVISHGSSTAVAIVNAVKVAHECATRGLVDRVAEAVVRRRAESP